MHTPFDAVQPIQFGSVDRLQVACIEEVDHSSTGRVRPTSPAKENTFIIPKTMGFVDLMTSPNYC